MMTVRRLSRSQSPPYYSAPEYRSNRLINSGQWDLFGFGAKNKDPFIGNEVEG